MDERKARKQAALAAIRRQEEALSMAVRDHQMAVCEWLEAPNGTTKDAYKARMDAAADVVVNERANLFNLINISIDLEE